jgi:drug/metabolite transporter (DMT)-like permease
LSAGVLIIGSSAIFVRWADAPGSVTAFYRMGIATALLVLPFARQIHQHPKSIPKHSLAIAFMAGLFFAVDLALWSSGVMVGGAATPTLMANTAPLWVGIGAWVVFGEGLNSRFWLGLLLAIAGASLVLGQELFLDLDFGLGALLGLLAAVFYGAYQLATQRGRAGLNTLSYFWIVSASSAFFLLITNLALGQPLLGYNQNTYLNFLALGLVSQVLGWMVINYAQGYLPASLVAPTLLGQPVVTAILASLLLGERFTFWHIIGGIAVIIGILTVHRSRT